MDKQKISKGLLIGAAASALIAFISVFLKFVKTPLRSVTGFELLKKENGGHGGIKFMGVMMIIFVVIIIAIAVFKFLGKLDGNTFALIFAFIGINLFLFSLYFFFSVESHRGIGLILNFIFSLIAAGCCVGSHFIKE